MSVAEELIGLAQFALSLGGFGVLAHTVAMRGDSITPYRIVLLWGMLLNTLGMGLILLIPVALLRWGVSEEHAVRIGSASFALLTAIIARTIHRGTLRTNPQKQYVLGTWPRHLSWLAGVIALMLSAANALAWPIEPTFGALEFAAIVALGIAVYQFMGLVFGAGQAPKAVHGDVDGQTEV
jgi:hypothetical protein